MASFTLIMRELEHDILSVIGAHNLGLTSAWCWCVTVAYLEETKHKSHYKDQKSEKD